MTTTTYTKYFETHTASAVVGENFGWLKSIAYFVAVVLPKGVTRNLHQRCQRSDLRCSHRSVAGQEMIRFRQNLRGQNP